MDNCTVYKMGSIDNTKESKMTKGFRVFRHWSSTIEFVYVKEGGLELEIDSHIHKLEKGWFFVIASNVMHTFLNTEKDSVLYVSLIPQRDIHSLTQINVHEATNLYSKCLLITNPTVEFVDIFYSLIFSDYGIYNRLHVFSKTTEMTLHLLAGVVPIAKKIKVNTIAPTDIASEIRDFIDENFSQPITLSMLANHLGFSETYCSKIIKQKNKVGFSEYLNQVRIREAIYFLESSDMSVTEVCSAVGYSSVSTFNRNFKRIAGVSPTEFRKG